MALLYLPADVLRLVAEPRFCAACHRLRCEHALRMLRGVCTALRRALPKPAQRLDAQFLYDHAAAHGSVALLTHAHLHAPPPPAVSCDASLYTRAAASGSVPALQWLECAYSQRNTTQMYEWRNEAAARAAARGHADAVQWLVAQGACLTADVYRAAARAGCISLLEWLCAQQPQPPSDCLRKQMADAAAHAGACRTLHFLQHAYAQHFDADTCAEAARGRQLQVLRWLRDEQHTAWDTRVCTHALENDDCALLAYACDASAPWPADADLLASCAGATDALRYMQQRASYRIDVSACMLAAAVRGRLRALQYLLQEYGSETAASPDAIRDAAAQSRQWRVLRWLHESGTLVYDEPDACALLRRVLRVEDLCALEWLGDTGPRACETLRVAASVMLDALPVLREHATAFYLLHSSMPSRVAVRRLLLLIRAHTQT